jgi:hypothetical protein
MTRPLHIAGSKTVYPGKPGEEHWFMLTCQHDSLCYVNATVMREGVFYCRQHDPQRQFTWNRHRVEIITENSDGTVYVKREIWNAQFNRFDHTYAHVSPDELQPMEG